MIITGVDVDACLVLVACEGAGQAEHLAKVLVEEQLAACVSLLSEGNPVCSFYQWKGALHKEQEVLLLIKTRQHCLETMETRIRALHSYEVPEFLVLPVWGGSADYLAWLRENTPLPAEKK